jgi:hypothetical protein
MSDHYRDEDIRDYPEVPSLLEKRVKRYRRGLIASVVVNIALLVSISVSLSVILKFNVPLSQSSTPVPPTPRVGTTPQITVEPTLSPTAVPTTVVNINLPLPCQNCQQQNVFVVLSSYSLDPNGAVLTLLITNKTNTALNMKVDSVKLLDPNSKPSNVSYDAYIAAIPGASTPSTLHSDLVPVSGTKYTLAIVLEQANAFSNFYQSKPFPLN